MSDVVEEDGLGLAGARHTLDGDVQHTGDRGRPAHAALLDLARLCLDAAERADQRTDGRHRAARLTAGDGPERLALLGGGALVHDDAHRPVALDHRTRRVEQHGEAEPVEPGGAVLATVDVEHEAGVAEGLGRFRRHARGRARTDEVTAARLEVLAADLPLRARHDVLRPRYVHMLWPAARSATANSGRAATAAPRTTRMTPVTRANHSPAGKSFSAATTAAIVRTQGNPIAPATTSTSISAQQQPRQ